MDFLFNQNHAEGVDYQTMYDASIRQPEQFWGEQSSLITWFSSWNAVLTGTFQDLNVRWFVNGQLNACYNCLDRHLELYANKTAVIWEGDNPQDTQLITYAQLYETVCRFANVLKKQGVKKGDRVCIYLPMIPELIVAMLACARIGAIHSVVFGGFSSEALKTRIQDLQCELVITANETVRAGKIGACKRNVDDAITNDTTVKTVIVIKRTENPIPWNASKDIWYHEAMMAVDADCPIEIMDSDDPLFILYTSGSTGKPKGIVHTTGGYLVYVATTFKYVFNCQPDDIYWCTADLGWITGHSYLLYGPLMNRTTTLLFEGTPSFPSFARYWDIIDKYQVNIFYTAPTAIRALRHEGEQWLNQSHRTSLKLLGSVGEPISPDVWQWYHDTVGKNRCPIVDTWWQTETGGILITPQPGAMSLKPGSAGKPFFGIEPEIIDETGGLINDERSGRLAIKNPWPGLMNGIFGNRKRFEEGYFKVMAGKYVTGDSAYRDADGYFWIIGRDDDIIKVSGHRIGTGEIESALLACEQVSEAAVTSVPDEIKGHAIYAYIVLKSEVSPSDTLKNKLIHHVRQTIGPIVTIAQIQWTQALPKTRSGKIMRRILQKIAIDAWDDLGDMSTLSDPLVIEQLIIDRKGMQ